MYGVRGVQRVYVYISVAKRVLIDAWAGLTQQCAMRVVVEAGVVVVAGVVVEVGVVEGQVCLL